MTKPEASRGRETDLIVRSRCFLAQVTHAADRYRQGLALTDLERPLLRLTQGILSDQEIRASGQEYRSAVADLGSLDVVAAEVTARGPRRA